MKKLKTLKTRISLALKGMGMGLADVIPGISGGTIALITGIYEDLIYAIKTVDPGILTHLFFGRFSKFWNGLKKIEYGFLVPLVSGIALSMFIGSQFINYLLRNYSPYTYSFFFGLIVASAFLLYFELPKVDTKVVMFNLVGMIVALLVVGVSSADLGHSFPVVFLAGSVAICALILPGISGAFILLLLGQYEFVIESFSQLPSTYLTVGVLAGGAFVGVVTFSRVVSFTLRRWRAETLGFLIGLMLGALRNPFQVLLGSSSDPKICFSWGLTSTSLVVVSGILGILAVVGLGIVRLKGARD